MCAQLCDGASSEERAAWALQPAQKFRYLNQSSCFTLSRVDNAQEYQAWHLEFLHARLLWSGLGWIRDIRQTRLCLTQRFLALWHACTPHCLLWFVLSLACNMLSTMACDSFPAAPLTSIKLLSVACSTLAVDRSASHVSGCSMSSYLWRVQASLLGT